MTTTSRVSHLAGCSACPTGRVSQCPTLKGWDAGQWTPKTGTTVGQ